MSEELLDRVRDVLAERAAREPALGSGREPAHGSGNWSAHWSGHGLAHGPEQGSGRAGLTSAQLASALPERARALGSGGARHRVDELHRELVGAGPLERLLELDGVTDVLVRGPRDVWIDRGDGLERVESTFPDDQAVRRLAVRLAASAGRRLDDATPYVDARLADGTRFHAVLSAVCSSGTCVSLRVPPRRAYSLEELVRRGSLPPAGAGLLRAIVDARSSFLVTGGAGTGKTTLLAALLSCAPTGERIVIVEDARELAPDHPHVVQLEARPPNVEGAGEVSVRTLVRQALRMRPDRLVVGEVRGPEVLDLLSALNTGHEGGCGTVHANAAAEVPARIEALGVTAGVDRHAVHSQLAAAVEVVLHVVRRSDGLRALAEIAGLERAADGLVVVRSAVRFDAHGGMVEGPGMAALARRLEGGGDRELGGVVG